MKKLIKVAMTLLMMVLVINVANAQQGPRPGGGNGQGFANGQGRCSQGLNLTEDQQAKMKSMHLNVQKEMLPLRNKMGENMARMKTLKSAENADMKAINKLIDENSTLSGSMAKIRAANHQEVRKILTEEQRIMFDSKSMRRGGKGNGNNAGCQRGGQARKQGAQKRQGTPRTGR